MTSVCPGGARFWCSCHGGAPSNSFGLEVSDTGARYAYAAPTSESFPAILENIRLSGAVMSFCLAFTMRVSSTQCTPMVGIQPNTGWNPALAAAPDSPSRSVALVTLSISDFAFADKAALWSIPAMPSFIGVCADTDGAPASETSITTTVGRSAPRRIECVTGSSAFPGFVFLRSRPGKVHNLAAAHRSLIGRHSGAKSPASNRTERQAIPAAIAEPGTQLLVAVAEVGGVDDVAADSAVGSDLLEW
jgi:hypothetical protein